MTENNKRVLILTDSLGCPRKETEVTKTWTDQVIRANSGKGYFFYTYCKRGLYANDIYCEYVECLKPDYIIVQVGVVDACRRVFTIFQEKVIRRIPIISKLLFGLSKKYYYYLTKRKSLHYTTPEDFSKIFTRLIENTKAKFCFLAIAPAGSRMKQIVFHFEEDVLAYNRILESLAETYPDRVVFIDPYQVVKQDELFLNDGHHLTDVGLDLVFKAVNHYLAIYKGGAI